MQGVRITQSPIFNIYFPILRKLEEVPFEAPVCTIPLQNPMPRVIQKAIFISEIYEVVITAVIFVNRVAE